MHKETIMKKVIATFIAIAVMFGAANAEITVTEQKYENVSKYAHKAVEDVTEEEIAACYNAVKNGGSYNIERKKVKIECAEEEMVVFRRLF